MTQLSGAQYLARAIHATGTHSLFALAGATHSPLLMEFEDLGGRIIGGRHESGTVGAADGYARRTGQTGFACIISEQGLSNALTAIMTAAQSESPIVVIATRFPDSWTETATAYSVDRHELTAPFVKFSRTVPSADRIGEYFHAACKAAIEGVPGPALLVVPMDMLTEETSEELRLLPQPPALPPARAEQISAMANMIAAAERPIIVTDVGAARGDCHAGLNALAHMGIPVLGNSLGRGIVPEVAPYGYPWPYAQLAAPQADLVIVVGAKLSMWFGYGKTPRFGENAKFLHLDDNAAAISRNVTVDLSVIAHMGDSLSLLATQLQQSDFQRDAGWLEAALANRSHRIDDICAQDAQSLHQLEIGAALNQAMPNNRLLVADGADILNFTFGRLRLHQARSYSDHLPMGAMGAGFPLAIGMAAGEAELAAKEQRPAAPTLHVTGDGSIGFFLAELDTAQRAGLNLKIIVSNDGKWGTEYHGQMLSYGRAANTLLGETNYAAIAQAFGMESQIATDAASLNSAVVHAAEGDGPLLIDVRIDPMGGKIRKEEPLVGMILFEDIAKKH